MLEETVAALPRAVDGFDDVEYLVIDDGSEDATAEVARAAGVDHIVSHKKNLGLARAFETGLRSCIEYGADVIANTDADNQYCAEDIPKLAQPILAGKADIVIGERPIESIEHFSPLKKFLQFLGSWVVRWVSNTEIQDAPSGFRAYSREAAMRLRVFGDYTYTLETIIQAGHVRIPMESVPVRVNGPTRRSRLVKSIPSYVLKSIHTIFRIFVTYKPLRFFALLALVCATPGVLLGLRFVAFYLLGDGEGHIQSLILAAILLISGCVLLIAGVLADLIAVNRNLLERNQWRISKLESAARER